MANIVVLGCGFGTALSVMFDKYGHKVTAWTKFQDEIDAILRDGEHKKLLPGVIVPPSIAFTTEIQCVTDADIVVFAIPSHSLREVARKFSEVMPKSAVLVNVGKGFEEKSGKRLSVVLAEEMPENPIVVLSGPSHAEEVGRDVPTAVVAASADEQTATYIQEELQNENFRIYLCDDMVGCELGAALKNPIALCCGIVEGMGLGDNTLAALMTRGLAEIMRLGVALGAKWETFTGLSGVGDLIVTCTSTHSRNHRAGMLIGQGMTAAEAVAKVGTVEGYACAKMALQLAREHDITAPLLEELCNICYQNTSPKRSLKRLMGRPLRAEKENFWNS